LLFGCYVWIGKLYTECLKYRNYNFGSIVINNGWIINNISYFLGIFIKYVIIEEALEIVISGIYNNYVPCYND
jgi:hypothetical protein